MDVEGAVVSPHVLIFPLPLQGPVNCMLKLAELLCLHNFHVTFLNTDHIQHRLLRYTHVQSRFNRFPKFRFQTIPDGLPENHPRSIDYFMDFLDSMEAVTYPLLKDMLTSGSLSFKSEIPVSCFISDGVFSFAVDIAKEVGIPLIYFETINPGALWTYLCLPKLIESGELPFKGNDLDGLITSVPGMESFLRRRDLPICCRTQNMNEPMIQLILKEDQKLPLAQGLILNTFEELEEPVLSPMRNLCPNLYPIAPLHTHIKTRLPTESSMDFSNSLWEEDKFCLTWLDAQPSSSVIYISIGSLAVMTKHEEMEFWHGLVNSGKRFLWVKRPGGFVSDEEFPIPVELAEGTKERGFIVGWTPQEEVLSHPSIGGFLNHGGWNSTLESIVEGVPMICWPYFADHQVISRFVGEVWKIGLDMKDTCDRVIIEKMVRDLMEVRRDEFLERVGQVAKLARESVSEGGSSYCNLDRLIQDIRLMTLNKI